MKPENSLSPMQLTSMVMNPSNWKMIQEQAEVLHKSGFMPANVGTPAKVIAIILKGMEKGWPPMYAAEHLYINNGKIGQSAESKLAEIREKFPDAVIKIIKSDAQKCHIKAARSKDDDLEDFEWSIEMAEAAELTKKDNWKKYPKTMLRWRCISDMARSVFPDAGCCRYTPEELNPDASFSEDGTVIDISNPIGALEEGKEPSTTEEEVLDEINLLLALISDKNKVEQIKQAIDIEIEKKPKNLLNILKAYKKRANDIFVQTDLINSQK